MGTKRAKAPADRPKAKRAEATPEAPSTGLSRRFYEEEMDKLQIELVKLQEWVRPKGLKVVVLFEGRDAAGKGGVDQAHHASA